MAPDGLRIGVIFRCTAETLRLGSGLAPLLPAVSSVGPPLSSGQVAGTADETDHSEDGGGDRRQSYSVLGGPILILAPRLICVSLLFCL